MMTLNELETMMVVCVALMIVGTLIFILGIRTSSSKEKKMLIGTAVVLTAAGAFGFELYRQCRLEDFSWGVLLYGSTTWFLLCIVIWITILFCYFSKRNSKRFRNKKE